MQEPGLDDLRDGALASFQSELNLSNAPKKNGFTYSLLTATAGLAKLLFKLAKGVYRNQFIGQADNSALAGWGANYGLTQGIAVPAQVQVKFLGNVDIILPAGIVLKKSDDTAFRTTVVVGMQNGIALVPAVALLAGELKGINAGDALKADLVLSNITEISIDTVFYVGQNAETDADFRARILAITQNQGPAGSQVYYIRQTLAQVGVAEAFVYRGSALAEVDIYPIMKNSARLPSASDLSRISSVVTNPQTAFLGDYVVVKAMNLVNVKMIINGLLPDDAVIKDRITAAFKQYIEARRPLQHRLERGQRASITQLDLQGVMSQSGAISGSVRLFIDNAELANYTLKSPVDEDYATPVELANFEEVSYE